MHWMTWLARIACAYHVERWLPWFEAVGHIRHGRVDQGVAAQVEVECKV